MPTTARSDYTRACPACRTCPRKGDRVIKVTRRSRAAWWHLACYQAEIDRVRETNTTVVPAAEAPAARAFGYRAQKVHQGRWYAMGDRR